LADVELVDVLSAVDDLAFGCWYGAAINESAVINRTIHFVIFIVYPPSN